MKKQERIQRFCDGGQSPCDTSDTSTLSKKDHNYYSMEEKYLYLKPKELSITKEFKYDFGESPLDSSPSDIFPAGNTSCLSFQSDSCENSPLNLDITPEDPTNETQRSNRPRLETRLRTDSSDSAFSEDSLIEFEGENNDNTLESLINQLMFNSDDLQTTDLSRYVKSDTNNSVGGNIFSDIDNTEDVSGYVKTDTDNNNSVANIFGDIDSFDVNDLFCSDSNINNNSKSGNKQHSDLTSVESPSSPYNNIDPHAMQWSPHLSIKTNNLNPVVEMNAYEDLDTRQSMNHTGPFSKLFNSSGVLNSYLKGGQLNLQSSNHLNGEVVESVYNEKDEPTKTEAISAAIFQQKDNYGDNEYCIIGNDGRMQKDTSHLETNYVNTNIESNEIKSDTKPTETKSCASMNNVNDSIIELEHLKRKCCIGILNKELGFTHNNDGIVQNGSESEATKIDKLLHSFSVFDTLGAYEDTAPKSDKLLNDEFGNVNTVRDSEPVHNPNNVTGDITIFDKQLDSKPESPGDNHFTYFREQLNSKVDVINDGRNREKSQDFRDFLPNKDNLKTILADLFLNEDYLDQNQISLSSTETKDSTEEYNRLDSLVIHSPNSQTLNDETDMLIEQPGTGLHSKEMRHNSRRVSNKKQTSKRRAEGYPAIYKNKEQSLNEKLHRSVNDINSPSDTGSNTSVSNTFVFNNEAMKINNNNKYSPSFGIVSSEDSNNKSQIKVPRQCFTKNKSVDSGGVGDSILRKVLTGKLTSPTSLMGNNKLVKNERKKYSNSRVRLSKSNKETLSKMSRKFPGELSELEKYLRGVLPLVNNNEDISDISETDIKTTISSQKYTENSFLQRLLTGELNSATYHEIDANICRQERISQLVRQLTKSVTQ